MIEHRKTVLALLLAALLLGKAAPAAGQDQDDDPAVTSALFLLRNAVRVRRDGRHNLTLRALRQLRDPELGPLFQRLTQAQEPSLLIHGFLGLVESQPQGQLDLERLASIKDGRLQAEIISAAMDGQLLSDAMAQRIVEWSEVEVSTRLLVGMQLAAAGKLKDAEFLSQAMESDNLGRRTVAGLILAHLGDPRGARVLEDAAESDDRQRDVKLEMALNLALRFEFAATGPWAMRVARGQPVDSRLSVKALQAAVRFHAPGAAVLWRERFAATTDLAQRVRLALSLLHVATFVEPGVFEPLQADAEPLLVQIGRTGAAVAGGKDVAQTAADLVRMRHPLSTDWAIDYARRLADEETLGAIVAAVFEAYPGPALNRSQRFEDAAVATQILCERLPRAAPELLTPILAAGDADPMLQQAVLVGLMRCQGTDLAAMLDDLPAFRHPDVSGLALFLQARVGRPLDPAQMRQLALLVRGGGDLPETFRVQAAWLYLKRAGRVQDALAALSDS